MSELNSFIRSLSSTNEDMLYQVFDGLSLDYSEDISEIKEQLVVVKQALNEINGKRSILSEDLTAIKHILLQLTDFIEYNDGDLVLDMLHYILSQQVRELSDGVQSTRPNELLDTKFGLKERQKELEIKQRIVESLLEEMTGK